MQNAEQVSFLLKKIHHRFVALFNEHLRVNDLTKTQMDILRFLESRQKKDLATRQKDIEQYFSISNPTVTGLLNRLECKDLIRRKSVSEDRRVRYIVLTEKGQRLFAAIHRDISRLEDEMIDGMDEKLVADGILFLQMLNDRLAREKGEEDDQNPGFPD